MCSSDLNLVTAARSVLAAAAVREETRGAHARSDFTAPDVRWRRRIVHQAGRTTVTPVLDGPAGDRSAPQEGEGR